MMVYLTSAAGRRIIQKYDVFSEELKAKGRPDIIVQLSYAGFKMLMIIEMEIETIQNGDDKSIKVAHERNLKEARKQVTLYTWEQATEDIIQRVVVSGVWHPSPRTTETYVPYKLNSIYDFLK
jgi:hypothetical protein